MVVEGEDHQVGVWRVPYDPVLPGMALALDDAEVGRLFPSIWDRLWSLSRPTPRLPPRGPGRGGGAGAGHDIFLKVIRPGNHFGDLGNVQHGPRER